MEGAQSERNEMRDLLAEESHRRAELEREKMEASANVLDVKRGRASGRRGGSDKWSCQVRLWIWEQIYNGTPPSAVPPNMQSAHSLLYGVPLKEVPSVSFVREQRIPMQVANLILSAYQLGKAKWWKGHLH